MWHPADPPWRRRAGDREAVQAFHDRLGDEVANELVGWFNDVDASYRGDLRELNELNFARADATFAQRLAQSETRMIERMARVESRSRSA